MDLAQPALCSANRCPSGAASELGGRGQPQLDVTSLDVFVTVEEQLHVVAAKDVRLAADEGRKVLLQARLLPTVRRREVTKR